MTPQQALVHAMQALDWENVPEDAEAVRVLRALEDWLLANAEDMVLDEDLDDENLRTWKEERATSFLNVGEGEYGMGNDNR